MYGLEIRQLVVIGVDADAEEEAGVAAVDDLQVAELDEVGLVLLVAGGDQAVDLWFGRYEWGIREAWEKREGGKSGRDGLRL